MHSLTLDPFIMTRPVALNAICCSQQFASKIFSTLFNIYNDFATF